MTTTDCKNRPVAPKLDAFDPELPFLASKAAVELDNLILGKPGDSHAVMTLAQHLQSCVERVPGTEEYRSLMDPATIIVFTGAVAASGIPKVQTFVDLARVAWQIANDLQSSDASCDTLRRLRTFCVNLAKIAVAQERSRLEMHSRHETWS